MLDSLLAVTMVAMMVVMLEHNLEYLMVAMMVLTMELLTVEMKAVYSVALKAAL